MSIGEATQRSGLLFAGLCAVNAAFVPAVAKLTTDRADPLFVAAVTTLFAGLAAALVLGTRRELRRLFRRDRAPVLILLGIYTRISIMTIIPTMVIIFLVLPFPIGFDVHGALTIEVQVYFTLVPLALFFTGPGRYRLMQNKSGNWLLD